MKIKSALLFICLIAFASINFAQTKEKAKEIDEFGNHLCEDFLARMDAFVNELSKVPNSKGYVLIYEGSSPKFGKDKNGQNVITDYILPQKGEVESRIKTMQRRFAFRGIPNEDIIFVKSGIRENYTVEFWLVPPGAESPKPAPTLKSIKYRKGKPKDFCGSDGV